jgi:hypothetical protein
MANTPVDANTKDPKHFQTVAALGSIGAVVIRTGDFVNLAKQRHFLTIIITLTTLFVVPFLTPIKNGLVKIVADDTGWDVIISQDAAMVLAVVYGLLTFCTFCILIRTWRNYTGLKWDPSPLACQISLIQGSNVPEAFQDFEYKSHQEVTRALHSLGRNHGILRLGYWQASHDDDDIFYGIRFMKWDSGSKAFASYNSVNHADVPLSRDSDHGLHPTGHCSNSPYLLAEEKPILKDRFACSPEYARYKMTLLNLNDAFLLIMFLFDLALIIACVLAIVKGCVKSNSSFATIPLHGQTFQKRQQSKGRASTPTEIFYTTGVGILIALFSIVWNPAENFYRRMQPVAGMALPKQAEENLLLDYVGPSAAQTLLSAVTNQHWRVACFSVLANLHPFTPIIARKAFVFVNEGDAIKVKAVPGWFYAGFAILVIYAILLGYARPPWSYRTPRDLQSFVDVISFAAYSRITDSEEFNIQDPTDEEVHFFSHIHSAKNRYLFGFYKGKDGRRHIGFDIAQRAQRSNAEYVDVVDPGISMDFGFRWFIRKPRIVRTDDRLINMMLGVKRMAYMSSRRFRSTLTQATGEGATPKRGTRRSNLNPPVSTGYEMVDNPRMNSGRGRRLRRPDTETRIGG